MRKGIVVTLGILSLFLLFTSSVYAWDDLIYLGGHYGGQPGLAWGAAGIRYGSASDEYDADGESQPLADDQTEMRIPIWGTYTPVEKLKLFAIVPFVSTDDGTDSESGIGDIWLGGVYDILEDRMLSIRGSLDAPTGDDEKGLGNEGGFGIDVAALSSKPINDQLGVHGQVGLRWNGEDSDTEWAPGIGFYLKGLAGYRINEKTTSSIGLVYFNQGDGEAGGNEIADSGVDWLELTVGGGYHLTEVIVAGVGLEYKLMGSNTVQDYGIRVGLGYTFMAP